MVRALLVQAAPAPGEPTQNALRAVRILEEHPDIDLAVFPELFLSGYRLDGVVSVALSPAGPELEHIANAARAMATAVVVGFAERTGDGIANSAACIDRDGRSAGVYRKAYLFGNERRAFIAGDELLLVELAGRRVGPMICFDVEFPEIARALTMSGAELLVTVSANMEPYYAVHELHARARALDNRRPHLYVNRIGSEAGFRFVGGSRAVDPSGEVTAQAASDDEALLTVDVPEPEHVAEVDYPRLLRPPLPVVGGAPGGS